MIKQAKSTERLFIESLPRSVPPHDVIAQAKAIGLSINLKKVYRVRGPASATVTTAAKKAPAAVSNAAKPAESGVQASPGSSKATFILSFPKSAKAREIIAAGAKQGIKVSSTYISVVRAGGRKSAKKATSKQKTSTATTAAPAAAIARQTADAGTTAERELVKIVLDIGFTRVESLIAEIRAKISSLF